MRTIDILDSFLVYSLFCRLFTFNSLKFIFFSWNLNRLIMSSPKKFTFCSAPQNWWMKSQFSSAKPCCCTRPPRGMGEREGRVREDGITGRSNGWTKSTKFALISSNRRTKLDFVHPLDEILWSTFKSYGQKMKYKFRRVSRRN